MGTTTNSAELERMVEIYEQALRLLVSKADDEASLHAYLRGPRDDGGKITLCEIARYETFRQVRRIAAEALNEFYPEIAVIQ